MDYRRLPVNHDARRPADWQGLRGSELARHCIRKYGNSLQACVTMGDPHNDSIITLELAIILLTRSTTQLILFERTANMIDDSYH